MIVPESTEPKIGIVIKSSADKKVSLEWALTLKRLDIVFNARFFLCVRNKEKVVEDILAHEEHYTHILFLQTEIQPPQTMIADLITFQAPIVSAIYRPKQKDSSMWELTEDNDKKPITEVTKSETFMPVDLIDMGCVLIDRRVFEKVDQPWFMIQCNEQTLDEDYKFNGDGYHFLLKAKKENFSPYVNLTCTCAVGD